MDFRKAHIPGSRWSIRPRIALAVQETRKTVVIIADDPDVARLAAVDIFELGIAQVRLLAGGINAWVHAGYRTEPSNTVPPDAECIDYLFFVHDRHAGNREAMKQYLARETGLIAQLSAEDRALFRIGLPAG